MYPLLVSTGIVALAEVGDKTQLLALVLAARFRRPIPIIAGILIATLANHGLAAGVGTWLPHLMSPRVMGWIVGLSFLAMAVWSLIPDKLDEDDARLAGAGVFGTTVVTFFLAEMADKTQAATIVLAAQYQSYIAVLTGTTLGMLIANVPVVLLGGGIAKRLPVKAIHIAVAVIFAVLGAITLIGTVFETA